MHEPAYSTEQLTMKKGGPGKVGECYSVPVAVAVPACSFLIPHSSSCRLPTIMHHVSSPVCSCSLHMH